jgi:hypothetical protein
VEAMVVAAKAKVVRVVARAAREEVMAAGRAVAWAVAATLVAAVWRAGTGRGTLRRRQVPSSKHPADRLRAGGAHHTDTHADEVRSRRSVE